MAPPDNSIPCVPNCRNYRAPHANGTKRYLNIIAMVIGIIATIAASVLAIGDMRYTRYVDYQRSMMEVSNKLTRIEAILSKDSK